MSQNKPSNEDLPTQVKNELESLSHGVDGFMLGMLKEKRMTWHLVAGLVMMFLAAVTVNSWTLFKEVLFFTAITMSMELLNAAVERVCDFVYPDFNIKIKKIKHVAAGAVFVISVVASSIVLIDYVYLLDQKYHFFPNFLP